MVNYIIFRYLRRVIAKTAMSLVLYLCDVILNRGPGPESSGPVQREQYGSSFTKEKKNISCEHYLSSNNICQLNVSGKAA